MRRIVQSRLGSLLLGEEELLGSPSSPGSDEVRTLTSSLSFRP
jgi:hypothetical protein